MPRKKKEIVTTEEKELNEEVFISNITNEKIYEGLICLDIKLGKLIDILSKVSDYVEDKRNGNLTV